MVDYNKFKKLKANRDKVKEKQKQNKIIWKQTKPDPNWIPLERLMKDK